MKPRLGENVQITRGLFSGVGARVVRLTETGRALLQLQGAAGLMLVIGLESIAPSS